jgi:DNA-binding NarL/FixJ family response regulator
VPVRVLIVDDHAEFRELARELLSVKGFEVVGEAGCRASALEAAERLRPDAVLLDLGLGQDSGVDVARELSRACPRPAVLLVSNADFDAGEDMLEIAGVQGFLFKWRLARVDLGAYWPDTSAPS